MAGAEGAGPLGTIPIGRDEHRHLARGPGHWRDRAEEANTIADQTHDPESKRQMREIAEGYERLAERAERRLAEPM
jgi:hypothetical protein